MSSQYGDEKKSCKALRMDLQNTQAEITRLLPDSDKTAQNVILGVTGWFLIVPWFFMDFKDAEGVEVNALRQRYNNLISIAEDKNCGFEAQQIPELPKNNTNETPEYPTGGRK